MGAGLEQPQIAKAKRKGVVFVINSRFQHVLGEDNSTGL